MDGTAIGSNSNTGMTYSGFWNDCPVEALRDKQTAGALWERTFNTMPGGSIPTTEGAFGDLAAFSSTGGTIAGDTTEIGGGWAFGSDGDNEGASIRTVVVPFKIILTGGDFWMEWRVLTSTITDTKHGIFTGLWENVALDATHPIAAAGTLSDNNFVGFHRLEGDGDYFDAVYKADGVTQVTVQADAALLVASTYTNLGLKFVPKRNIGKGAGYLYWYQDGVVVGSKLIPSGAGTDFPNDVNLGFVFAVLNATGTTPGTSTVKHVRMAQLATAMP